MRDSANVEESGVLTLWIQISNLDLVSEQLLTSSNLVATDE